MKEKAETIRVAETIKALNKLENLTEREKNIINALTGVVVNKLLHEPIVRAKQYAGKKEGYLYIESLRFLFDLKEKESTKTQEGGESEA